MILPYFVVYFLMFPLIFLKGSESKFYLLLYLAIIALFGGGRFETGYDWLAYEMQFNDISLIDSLWPQISNSSFEPLYFLVCYFVKIIGGSVQSVFMLSAIASSFSLYFILTRFRVNYFVPVAIYMAFAYLIAYFIVVRFAFAAAFIGPAIYFALRGSKLKSYICLIVACGFHFFSIFLFPMLLVFRRKINGRKFLVGIIFAALGMVAVDYNSLLGSLVFLNDGFFSKYSAYSVGWQEGISLGTLAYLAFNFLVFYFVKMRSFSLDKGLLNLFGWMTLMISIAIIIAFPIPSIWNRLSIVFCPIQGLALAFALEESKKALKLCGYLFIFSVSLFGLAYNLLQEDSYFLPYQSIYESLFFDVSDYSRLRMQSNF